MKSKFWNILGALISLSILAQMAAKADTNATSSATAATAGTTTASKTNAPAAKAKKSAKKKSEKKSAAKKAPSAELKTVPLIAGPAVVVASNVNVRAQSKLKSEVVTRLTKGAPVTVLEEIVHNNSGPDEPSAWAKIVLPQAVHVWVNTIFIEGTNKTVKVRKINVRAGPGENYSILGTLKRGDAVKEMGTKGDWMEIEAPSDAYAFMAAQYLRQEAPGAVAVTEPPPTPTPVTEPPTVTPPTTEPPTVAPAITNEPPTTTATTEPKPNEPPPKRVVQREGFVRGTFSIQAPTRFELISPDNHKTMNYLYTSSKDLDLRRYKGMRIIVTGEEGLDERWRNTPVISIQRIQVLE